MGTWDREEEVPNEPNLRDQDSKNWPIFNSQDTQPAAAAAEFEGLTLLHPKATPGGRAEGQPQPDVNNLVAPIAHLHHLRNNFWYTAGIRSATTASLTQTSINCPVYRTTKPVPQLEWDPQVP